MLSAYYVSRLRRELSERNQKYARARSLVCHFSYGESPVVLYVPDERSHGNFLPETYASILMETNWRRRLEKVHAQARKSLPQTERRWRELDSSNSSDALLMNVFCHPAALADGRVSSLLGVERDAEREFGFKARVPLEGGKGDRTEVDLRFGDLLIEAKLTESDFQTKSCEVMEGYRDFREVFDRRRLPRVKKRYASYQLLRNVLAAKATGMSFCVLADERRPDLKEAWYAVMLAVKDPELKRRLKMLTWQELAEALPAEMRGFLGEKYGIGD